ncbi:hypothetical protein SKAU_G00036000, partial [Synaphobranchus kaupii]
HEAPLAHLLVRQQHGTVYFHSTASAVELCIDRFSSPVFARKCKRLRLTDPVGTELSGTRRRIG